MLKDIDILEIPDIHRQPSLYICSNTDASETPFTAFWQQQLATLKQEAIPFRFLPDAPQPTLLLDIEQHPRLPGLLEHHDDAFDYWPSWCTYMTADQHLSDTFLFLSVSHHENYRLILRFEHSQHFAYLEQIAQANRLILAIEPQSACYTVSLDEARLTGHLDVINSARKRQ
ncbi:hypothetical protein [Dictyobacter aurantiacus]|uniref:Uncharacterized protein n=1 Tax=Dictyobacter aurantiacus TaxID=1936993 RepID=A0A401ZIX2_9CHLR|nr:hypothetical protein [Dictyobacter aurantiacus]GCE06797.1 hypothetical protein KDAU_41260 [Dictyobacter aurantiacus]